MTAAAERPLDRRGRQLGDCIDGQAAAREEHVDGGLRPPRELAELAAA